MIVFTICYQAKMSYAIPPMPATVMLGQPIVDEMICEMKQCDFNPTLAVIQVGHDPRSDSYMKQLHKMQQKLDQLTLQHIELSIDTTWHKLERILRTLNKDKKTDGYMIQEPLPTHLKMYTPLIRDIIDEKPAKDVDFLGHKNRGQIQDKLNGQLVPPTPYGVMRMLRHYLPPLSGKSHPVEGRSVAIIGDGQVGKLLKIMVGNDNGTQLVCNLQTQKELQRALIGQADIVVGAAENAPDIITGDMIKPDATVINVGMISVDGKIKGNVDVSSVKDVASMYTPVLGGTGTVTIATLVLNLFRSYRRKKRSR